MKIVIAAAAAAGVVLAGGTALAFGTVHGAGQNAEHERITRHALENEFGPRTLDQLAGARGSFGAVGAPDNPTRGLLFQSSAHCDNGDHLDAPAYPRGAAEARAMLESCRDWMRRQLDAAVADAAALLNRGKVSSAAVSMSFGCGFTGGKGRAKCNVLEDLGLLLHTAQDFYAHTNWADVRDPDEPAGIANPEGLGNAQPAPWIALRGDVPFPRGLISGCFAGEPERAFCRGHVRHADLNKDTGTIDPQIGTGTTPRGAFQGTFRSAVEAAIADSRDKWALFKARLVARYGAHDGALMACAVSHDDPAKDC